MAMGFVRGALAFGPATFGGRCILQLCTESMCVPYRLILALKMTDLISDSADQRRHPIAACTKRSKERSERGRHSHAIL